MFSRGDAESQMTDTITRSYKTLKVTRRILMVESKSSRELGLSGLSSYELRVTAANKLQKLNRMEIRVCRALWRFVSHGR